MRNLDNAVSEILGAVLLVSVVMGGITLVSVFMFSTPPPDSIPQVTLNGFCCNQSGDPVIVIAHNGGDGIKGSDLALYVNGAPYSNPMYYPNGTELNINKSPIEADPKNIFKTGDAIKINRPLPYADPREITLEIYPDHMSKSPVKRLAILVFNCTSSECNH